MTLRQSEDPSLRNRFEEAAHVERFYSPRTNMARYFDQRFLNADNGFFYYSDNPFLINRRNF